MDLSTLQVSASNLVLHILCQEHGSLWVIKARYRNAVP